MRPLLPGPVPGSRPWSTSQKERRSLPRPSLSDPSHPLPYAAPVHVAKRVPVARLPGGRNLSGPAKETEVSDVGRSEARRRQRPEPRVRTGAPRGGLEAKTKRQRDGRGDPRAGEGEPRDVLRHGRRVGETRGQSFGERFPPLQRGRRAKCRVLPLWTLGRGGRGGRG